MNVFTILFRYLRFDTGLKEVHVLEANVVQAQAAIAPLGWD